MQDNDEVGTKQNKKCWGSIGPSFLAFKGIGMLLLFEGLNMAFVFCLSVPLFLPEGYNNTQRNISVIFL